MAFNKRAEARPRAFGFAAQKVFLAQLAQTANVSASARAAGISTGPVYELRRKSPAFCAKWLAALAEGYARLEANLLAEALSPPAPHLKDSTLKQKQLKTRIGMALHAAHKATVRGSATVHPPTRSRDAVSVRARLEARFAAMHKRLADDERPGQ